MKHNFPPVFKIIGLILAIPGFVLGYLFTFFNYLIPFLNYGPLESGKSIFGSTGRNNLTDEIAISFFVTGMIFIGFSRLKNENELTNKLRLNALYWSVLINILIILIDVIGEFVGELFRIPALTHHAGFLSYDAFVVLPIFIARFYYLVHKSKKEKQSEQIYMLPFKPYNLIWKVGSLFFIISMVASLTFPVIDTLLKQFPDCIIILFPACLLIWIWSKEKNETDLVKDIRTKAMQIAMYVNYTVFLITTWLIYGFDYLVVQVVSILSLPIIFLIVFYLKLYILRVKPTIVATTNL